MYDKLAPLCSFLVSKASLQKRHTQAHPMQLRRWEAAVL